MKNIQRRLHIVTDFSIEVGVSSPKPTWSPVYIRQHKSTTKFISLQIT